MIKNICFDEVEQICNTYFLKALKESGLRSFSFSKSCLSKALWNEDDLISLVVYRKVAKDLVEIDFIATRLKFQRSGAAQRLLDTFNGFEVWLELRESNHKALSFYQKAGFVITGKRSSYYSDGGTALNMARK